MWTYLLKLQYRLCFIDQSCGFCILHSYLASDRLFRRTLVQNNHIPH